MDLISRAEAKAAGLTRFYTGAACKWGHVAERMVGSGGCRECHRVLTKARFAANPDRARAMARAWVAANPDRARATRNAWAAANRDKKRAHAAAWGSVSANRDKRRA